MHPFEGIMESILAIAIVSTGALYITAWILDPVFKCCSTRSAQPVHDHWKPFGMYNGHVLYERTYASGKKSWRYEDKDGDGHIYMGATALQNEIITPI